MIMRYQKIREAIEKALELGKKNFIIYPFGNNGVLTKQVLNGSFGIEENYIVDNQLSLYNPQIKNLEYFKDRDCSQNTVLLTIENPDVYKIVHDNAEKYFYKSNIVDIFPWGGIEEEEKRKWTICGKYSYGSLCEHRFVESVGAFCSFAKGCDVVENHVVDYISTHPFLYADCRVNKALWYQYEECQEAAWYFPGVEPRGVAKGLSRIKIGNDVWLGRNVIITNGANIGNGVIAGAGAIITKDVPDYAVVLGVPARIIRYRYTKAQIEKLNKIAWWDWPDEVIRKRYNDFFIKIDEFIEKYENTL